MIRSFFKSIFYSMKSMAIAKAIGVLERQGRYEDAKRLAEIKCCG